MAKNKAIFLDRDGTINKDFGYTYKTENLQFLDGAIEGLKNLYKNGYKLIIITNQSGIGRNFYNIKEYTKFTEYMLKQLKEYGIIIEKVYYCPHVETDNCECRKPNLGLFYQAIQEYDIDLDTSYAIGDRTRDIEICNHTNVKGLLISSETNDNYLTFDNLKTASDYIISKNTNN